MEKDKPKRKFFVLKNPYGTNKKTISSQEIEEVNIKDFEIEETDVKNIKVGQWFFAIEPKEITNGVTTIFRDQETRDFIFNCQFNYGDGERIETSTLQVLRLEEEISIIERINKLLKEKGE